MKKKVTAVLLCMALACGCLSACGETDGNHETGAKGNNQTDVEIGIWNAGIGVEWLDEVIEKFEKTYPEYHVFYTASASTKTVMSTFGMPDVDTKDLYMSIWQTDSTYLEPLDDVLDATIEGEAISIREKFNDNFLSVAKAKDGHYYQLPHAGGVMGIAYNATIFEEAGIKQIPRTTDELLVVCDKLYNKNITPLCHFVNGGYYHFLHHEFMAQYDGADYLINQFYACKDENGTSPSKDALKAQDGRYYALKTFEKLLTPEYVLQGSNSKTHTEIQTEFLNNKAAMMYNGSWMMNEMKRSSNNGDIKFMKTPVISAIINKLSTVKSDAQLRTLITAIDQVTSGEKQLDDFAAGENYAIENMTVSKADWDKVYQARNAIGSNFEGEGAYIPNYSAAKEGAKLFLKFMYSDEGYQTFVDITGCPRPMTMSDGKMPDVSKLGEFAQVQFDWIAHAESFISEYIYSRHEIFNTGGATYLGSLQYASSFSTYNEKDRKTADQIWENFLKKVDDSYETSWLKNMKQ